MNHLIMTTFKRNHLARILPTVLDYSSIFTLVGRVWIWHGLVKSQSQLLGTYFLQQSHAYFNNGITLNPSQSSTNWQSKVQIYKCFGDILIQTSSEIFFLLMSLALEVNSREIFINHQIGLIQ